MLLAFFVSLAVVLLKKSRLDGYHVPPAEEVPRPAIRRYPANAPRRFPPEPTSLPFLRIDSWLVRADAIQNGCESDDAQQEQRPGDAANRVMNPRIRHTPTAIVKHRNHLVH